MKKNGFIATSLIYSFFLIFITLFLSIIADYLQDKVLLNEIESEIKNNINDSMGIRDFEVGDVLYFVPGGFTDLRYTSLTNDDSWIVSKVYVDTNVVNSYIVLYSHKTSYNTSCLTLKQVHDDLISGYLNDTYLNKILYNFDGDNYTISGVTLTKESKTVNAENLQTTYINHNSTSTPCRKRYELYIGNDRLKKDSGSIDFITLTEVLS